MAGTGGGGKGAHYKVPTLQSESDRVLRPARRSVLLSYAALAGPSGPLSPPRNLRLSTRDRSSQRPRALHDRASKHVQPRCYVRNARSQGGGTTNMQRAANLGSGTAYRPEIEGLRVVAATLVATFHVWLGRVSGGVDVFFVVSGFLITSGLTVQIERNGMPQFAAFWARLINRLVPPALLVLLAVAVASYFLLPESRWSDTIKHVAASALYVENWWLANDSVDYLRQDGPVSPVQHFWALSTQGQFYLLWPLVLGLAAVVARRAKLAFRGVAVVTLLSLFAVSLAYSVWLTGRDQPLAYFVTTTRVWEFAVGGLLALFINRLRLPSVVRVVLGWVGLLAIVSCGLLLQVSRVFPGYAALWPVLGGAFVLIAGTSGSRFGVDRFLGSAPMIYLGSISYGFYLWHFPILEIYRTYTKPGPVDLVPGALIIVSSLALAVLMRGMIEAPVKRAKIGAAAPWRAYAFGALCTAPVTLVLAAVDPGLCRRTQRRVADRRRTQPRLPGGAGARVAHAVRGRSGRRDLSGSLLGARGLRSARRRVRRAARGDAARVQRDWCAWIADARGGRRLALRAMAAAARRNRIARRLAARHVYEERVSVLSRRRQGERRGMVRLQRLQPGSAAAHTGPDGPTRC